MPIPKPLDPSPRRISDSDADEEGSVAVPMRRPELERLLDEVTALLRARRLADARRRASSRRR
jgi:hypothetical protein